MAVTSVRYFTLQDEWPSLATRRGRRCAVHRHGGGDNRKDSSPGTTPHLFPSRACALYNEHRSNGSREIRHLRAGRPRAWVSRLSRSGGRTMVELERRAVLIGSAGIAATLAAATPVAAGDPSFMNNVPDGLLSGDQLPTFKFRREKSAGKE